MSESREGQRVPATTFRTRLGSQWVDVSTDELFKGRTVIVFSLPGADTFPQVFVNGEHIGGADDLEQWLGAREAA